MRVIFVFALVLSHGLAEVKLNAVSWPDQSIYHLKGTWTNHKNKSHELSDFAGKNLVVAMVYTSCQHTCPIITRDVIKIRSKIPENKIDQFRFVLMSFDSDGDTPEVLAKYKQEKKLGDDWSLIKSDPITVLKLAAVLGVKIKQNPGGGFSHSNIISLIDKRGVVIEQILELNQPIETLV